MDIAVLVAVLVVFITSAIAFVFKIQTDVKLKIKAEEVKAEDLKVKAEDLKVKAEDLKVKAEDLRLQTEKVKGNNILLEGRSKGIHGASMSPSALAKTMPPVRVEPWFQEAKVKFNDVTVIDVEPIGDAKAKTKQFVAGNANKACVFTQTAAEISKVSEDDVQKAWTPSFQHVMGVAQKNSVYWIDGHASKWLKRPTDEDETAPDGIAHARAVSGKPDPALIVGVHDNKCSRGGNFTNDDRGKLFQYCLVLLQFYQPARIFIGASLFDGCFAQCFKVCRDGAYTTEATRVLDLRVAADARLYAGFMTSSRAMGWNIGKIAPCAGEYLGRGGTSVVFAHLDNTDYVVKVPLAEQSHLLERERNMLLRIGTISSRLVHIVEAECKEKDWLVLSPRFSRLKIFAPFDITLFCSLIGDKSSPLRALHIAGYVHCDLRPDNIMTTANGNELALVDVGAVREAGVAGIFDHGTVSFASNGVLKAWASEDQSFVFKPADDLVSVVRCVLVMDSMAESFRKHVWELGRDANKILSFWREKEKLYPWSKVMMQAAEQCDYDALCEHIRRRHHPIIPEE
jgi:hypothetical protein